MKRHAAMLVRAFLILLVAINIIPPLRAVAQHGTVTINGQVTYQPRNWNPQLNNWAIGKEIQIDLYEKDLQGNDHYLATTYTTLGGYFSFPARENWWNPDNRQLNIFFKVITSYVDTAVTDRLFRNYAFASPATFLSYDGTWTLNFPITIGYTGHQAIWIFEDLRNAWHYVANFGPHDPGAATAVWESSLNCYPIQLPDWTNIPCGSFAYGGIITHFIFIAHSSVISTDTVVHETGHMYVINSNSWWYTGCLIHYMFTSSNLNCAWSEGWANFFPLAVNGNQCYDFTENPCSGTANQDYYDLEAHSRADNPGQFTWGDQVEGRVAGSLYDFYDYNSEGFDRIFAGFYPIAQIALGSTQVTTTLNFWNRWKTESGQDEFVSGLTLWWNTISYVNIRQVFLPTVMK
jgi:hypothetical protein